MESHAYTLHTALARRGHHVHVFTSPLVNNSSDQPESRTSSSNYPRIHCHEGEVGKWRRNKAWELFDEENLHEPFDVIHLESVARPHRLARNLKNLSVSLHGIALESLQSNIYQDLTRNPHEPMSPAFNDSLYGVVSKVLNEIRFFHDYNHHVAISDSCGEMLRDVYQIPRRRVHVILNGVDENDKEHPQLYKAFSKLIAKHHHVYLIVVGTGPWENRYKELGPRIRVLGSMSSFELTAFYNAIDVFVNPTLRPQGLDLTPMEAMMSGKAVVASRFPSIKDSIIVDDEFGFMFSPNVESLLEASEEVVREGPKRLARRKRTHKNMQLPCSQQARWHWHMKDC
ncbi:hypothetical protein F3Y22_tig00110156pilonHSYRG00047 [Hibiscus syriacus]|uniref:Uncharacterized protein n=1 Tax=Hibiscus syriacus TaxID=106335 RepID=A0A6A3BIA1_HIBSY|nr:hypothetical protein F3Y22_tig00110156pilonHSYRG00047 [Hibiscus syriacus]